MEPLALSFAQAVVVLIAGHFFQLQIETDFVLEMVNRELFLFSLTLYFFKGWSAAQSFCNLLILGGRHWAWQTLATSLLFSFFHE